MTAMTWLVIALAWVVIAASVVTTVRVRHHLRDTRRVAVATRITMLERELGIGLPTEEVIRRIDVELGTQELVQPARLPHIERGTEQHRSDGSLWVWDGYAWRQPPGP